MDTEWYTVYLLSRDWTESLPASKHKAQHRRDWGVTMINSSTGESQSAGGCDGKALADLWSLSHNAPRPRGVS